MFLNASSGARASPNTRILLKKEKKIEKKYALAHQFKVDHRRKRKAFNEIMMKLNTVRPDEVFYAHRMRE